VYGRKGRIKGGSRKRLRSKDGVGTLHRVESADLRGGGSGIGRENSSLT